MAQLAGVPGNAGQVEPVLAAPLEASVEERPRLDGDPGCSGLPLPGTSGPATEEDKDTQNMCITGGVPFKTLQHAFVAFLGLGGAACFTIALVFGNVFDACVAVALSLLCGYVFALQTERYGLEITRQQQPLPKLNEVLATDEPSDAESASRAQTGPSAASGMSELDLTGYAKTLGVSMRSGLPTEGSTLNKILMNALAKEYLRCVSALRCYQSAFGPLEDATLLDVQAARPDGLGTSLILPVDMVESGVEQTPRSPRGPPSPDEKRRRAYTAGFQEAEPMQETPDFQRSPEEHCTSVRSIGTALQHAASSFTGAACSSADPSPSFEACAENQYKGSTVTPSFAASPERPAIVSETPPAPRTTTRYYDTPTSLAGPEPPTEAAVAQAEQPPTSSFGLFR